MPSVANNQQLTSTPDTQTLLEHQQIIAQTHPDGSFFLTPEGTYVQLVNGVLRTVEMMGQVIFFLHQPTKMLFYSTAAIMKQCCRDLMLLYCMLQF
jgi:hypothetical protein